MISILKFYLLFTYWKHIIFSSIFIMLNMLDTLSRSAFCFGERIHQDKNNEIIQIHFQQFFERYWTFAAFRLFKRRYD